MPSILDIALAKAKPHGDTRKWCGDFTPAEILALVKAGVRPAERQDRVIDRAHEAIAKGEGGCWWFYFFPSGVKMRHTALTKHDKSATL